MRSPRAVILVAGLLALLLVGVAALLRARGRLGTPTVARRTSPWVVPRARRPPRLITAPAPVEREGKRPASLVVRVEDIEGGAIPGARVELDRRSLGLTDELGRLALDAAALELPEHGWLQVSADGYGTVEERYTIPDELRVRLIIGSVLHGRVVRAGTDVAVPGLEVRAGQLTARCDDAGRFSINELPAALVRVGARGEGWSGELAHPIAMGPGRTVEVVIPVSRAFTIRGRVLLDGRPITGEARVEGGGVTARASAGRFALVGVVPGRYSLEAALEPVSTFFTLGPVSTATVVDRDVEADIELGPRHGLVVEAVDGDGRPLPRVAFSAHEGHEGSTQGMSCDTGADGRCLMGGLLPGRVKVERTYSTESRTIPIPASGPVRFVLAGLGSVGGRLTTTDGHPPSRRYLFLTGAARVRPWTTSAPDGSFHFPFLGAGEYTLWVEEHPAELTQAVTLRAGEQRDDLLIKLPAETARLEGRVVDAAGAPVPDALVSQRRFDPAMLYGGSFDRGAGMTTTDAAGRFVFDGMVPGRHYTLLAYRITGESAVVKDVPATAPVELRLVAKASLRVRARGGEAQGTFTLLTVTDGKKTLGFTTDGQAGATLHLDGLPIGTWNVLVRRGLFGASTRAVFEAGKTTELELTLAERDDDE